MERAREGLGRGKGEAWERCRRRLRGRLARARKAGGGAKLVGRVQWRCRAVACL